jgi:hypothetical protein
MQTTQVEASRQRQALSDFINPEPNSFFVYNEQIVLVSTDRSRCFLLKRGEEDKFSIRTGMALVNSFDQTLPETAKVVALPIVEELSVEQIRRLGVSEEILEFVLKHIGLETA